MRLTVLALPEKKKKSSHTRLWHNHSSSNRAVKIRLPSAVCGTERGRLQVSLVTWEVTTQVSGNYKDKLNLSNSRQNFTKFEHSYGRNSISKERSGNTTPPTCQAPSSHGPSRLKACGQGVPEGTRWGQHQGLFTQMPARGKELQIWEATHQLTSWKTTTHEKGVWACLGVSACRMGAISPPNSQTTWWHSPGRAPTAVTHTSPLCPFWRSQTNVWRGRKTIKIFC